MTFILKNWKYFLILLVPVSFFFGQFSSRGMNDYDTEKKYAIKINTLEREIEYLEAQKSILHRVGLQIRAKIQSDSLKYLIALRRNKSEIDRLKLKISEINFKNATTEQLDSIRHQLYGTE